MNRINHINKLLPKLSSACFFFFFFLESLYSYSNMSAVTVICFAYFHATVEYGIIFWGDSIDNKSLTTTEKDN